MKSNYFLIVIFLLISIKSTSQSGDFVIGAKSYSLGNANVTISDHWSVFNNPAGLAGSGNSSVFTSFLHRNSVEGLNSKALGFVLHNTWGNCGISAVRFGDEYYNEQQVSCSFAHKTGFVGLGARLNYFQVGIMDYGNKGTFSVDVGGVAELLPELVFGASISNVSQSALGSDEFMLPIIMKAGLTYIPVEFFRIHVNVSKDMGFDERILAGIEYRVRDTIFLRAGLNTRPYSNFFGLGVEIKRFIFDYGYGANPVMGISHQLSLTINFHKSS